MIICELDLGFLKPAVEANWIAELFDDDGLLQAAELACYRRGRRPELAAPTIEALANEVHRRA